MRENLLNVQIPCKVTAVNYIVRNKRDHELCSGLCDFCFRNRCKYDDINILMSADACDAVDI
jgi:hypothetical protein